jgi:Fe-S-cluster-containing dehydrogenase component
VACKQENGAADGVTLLSVWEDAPRMAAGKLEFAFRVSMCRHCDDPPYAAACPAEAIGKRLDGIVVLDEGECTRCRA